MTIILSPCPTLGQADWLQPSWPLSCVLCPGTGSSLEPQGPHHPSMVLPPGDVFVALKRWQVPWEQGSSGSGKYFWFLFFKWPLMSREEPCAICLKSFPGDSNVWPRENLVLIICLFVYSLILTIQQGNWERYFWGLGRKQRYLPHLRLCNEKKKPTICSYIAYMHRLFIQNCIWDSVNTFTDYVYIPIISSKEVFEILKTKFLNSTTSLWE